MLMVGAAAKGLGIAYVPEPAARPWLSDRRLVPLLKDWSPHISGLRLYYPGHRLVPASLHALIDIVREAS